MNERRYTAGSTYFGQKRLIGFLWLLLPIAVVPAQQPDVSAIVRDLDAANQSRFDNVISFTDVEHYTVFRGSDQTHPAAEMNVRITYTKGIGKRYIILSQSGSSLIQKAGLEPLLENEKSINDPTRLAQSWYTTSKYEMTLKTGGPQVIDGRACIAVTITPRRKAPNMIEGTLWVDVGDHTLVQVEGTSSKSPSMFAGTTKMMRRYANMQGYAMATHARAESSSILFGRTVIVIDYSDYHFQIRR